MNNVASTYLRRIELLRKTTKRWRSKKTHPNRDNNLASVDLSLSHDMYIWCIHTTLSLCGLWSSWRPQQKDNSYTVWLRVCTMFIELLYAEPRKCPPRPQLFVQHTRYHTCVLHQHTFYHTKNIWLNMLAFMQGRGGCLSTMWYHKNGTQSQTK